MAVATMRASPVSKSSAVIETLHTHTRVRAEFGIFYSRSYENILKATRQSEKFDEMLRSFYLVFKVLTWARVRSRARAYLVKTCKMESGDRREEIRVRIF